MFGAKRKPYKVRDKIDEKFDPRPFLRSWCIEKLCRARSEW